MSACCVSGCKNRHSSTSKLKFYRIPSGRQPFQANRRRLWLQAIQQVNGSTEELRGNARVCGAHFKSQEASLDHDSPDFVPSVFTSSTQSAKKKKKWFLGRRKRRRRTANVETEKSPTLPQVDPPVDLQPSGPVMMEETPSAPSVPKKGEIEDAEIEIETETASVISQTTSSPNKVLAPCTAPAGFPELDKGIPVVLLKHVYLPAWGYQCEHCDQSFTKVSRLLKHKRLHEEEEEEEEEESSFMCEICGETFTSQEDFTEHQLFHEASFPCNMCDRSFTTSHNLKRHKLLHVRDGRKCRTCGVLFCKRHNHVLFRPLVKSVTEYEEEEESTDAEPQKEADVMPETHPPVKSEPGETADLEDGAASTVAVLPLLPPKLEPLSTHQPPSSASQFPPPVFIKPPLISDEPPPVTRIPRTSFEFRPPFPNYPVLPPPPRHVNLPPSLKLFSPRYLTSALLEVKRNYKYILGNSRNVVKEEPNELPLIPPDERIVIKAERMAYDMEVVL